MQLKAHAKVDGKEISSDVISADRVMQAFLFEHLIPTKEQSCVVRKEKWGVPICKRVDDTPVILTPGATTTLRYNLSSKPKKGKLSVVLEDAPEGITIEGEPRFAEKSFSFDIKASDDIKSADRNMLVSVWVTAQRIVKEKPRTDKWRLRYLPAIPVTVKVDATPVLTAKQL